MTEPFVASVSMGYGHLRPAYAIAQHLNTPVEKIDGPPWTSRVDETYWQRTRSAYEGISRASQTPIVGRVFRGLLDSLTDIPSLYPKRDLSGSDIGSRYLDKMILRGFCDNVVQHLKESQRPLLTTFYAPAIAASKMGVENVFCVVTDSDVHRIWAPVASSATNIQYLAPSPRVKERLNSYGVPRSHIHMTGFPLPPDLLGGPDLESLKANLSRRLTRLDPRSIFREQLGRELGYFLPEYQESDEAPVHLVFAVGGAGAQSDIASDFLPSLRGMLETGRVRITLVAGTREEVKDRFIQMIGSADLEVHLGNSIQILHKQKLTDYFMAFNDLMQNTDILWTKPSELTFFGALGLPLILSPPMGNHERYNRRWATENGAAIKQRNPKECGDWLPELLHEGTLAAMAWSGYIRLPKFGLFEIAERVKKIA